MTVIGTLIGERFRLEEKVGSGGMSSVYRAYDPTPERRVAIKMMHRDISSDPDQLERFRREARAVAQLNHPHVVTVIDAGEDEGAPYIVFEYVEGETLKERIRRLGRLPIDEAIAFGIARSMEAQGLTATGRVLGTTDYVSPEQALGHEVTEQSDIYSLGIVLYEMLTGEVPFQADTQVAVAMKHVREPMPDAQRRRPEISATLAAVVERATTKETDNRYATVDDMVHDLEEVLAIEAARTGQTTGEATTVLRNLPGDTADFAPQRLRHPRRAAVLALPPARPGHLHAGIHRGRVRLRQRAGTDRALDQGEPDGDGEGEHGDPAGHRPAGAPELPALDQRAAGGRKGGRQGTQLDALAAGRRLMPIAALLRVPLHGQLQQPVEQLRVRHPARLPQLRVHARGGEAGDRVELVDEHPVLGHEEVHSRHPA